MSQPEQRRVLNELKSILKQKKITYALLSQKTNIPESSLKKIFAGGDCSFSKIIHIVNQLDLDFFQLIEGIAQKKEEAFFSFSYEQEVFFSNNLIYYLYFHKIFKDRISSQNAMSSLNLNEKDLWPILRKLEEFNLLEIIDFPKTKFLVQGGINFIPEGPLQNKLMGDVMKSFCQYLLKGPFQKKPVDSPFVRLYFAKTSKETFNFYLKELKQLHSEFANMAIRDRKFLNEESLIDSTWLFGLGNCHGMDLTFPQ